MKKLFLILFFITLLVLFIAFAPVAWGWKMLVTFIYIVTIVFIVAEKNERGGEPR